MSRWIGLLCLLTVLSPGQSYWTIQKSPDGGYNNILVAIHSSIPEDSSLIQKIKELFTLASPVLHVATKGGAYFRSVSISVPNTWRQQPSYENATEDLFTQAHFRVDTPAPEHGDEPYTLQPKGCGEPGLYTHWTPNYLRNPISVWPSKYNEQKEVRLVQEWAHLRYGVFEEFGYPGNRKFPIFTVGKNGEPEFTQCNANIRGTFDVGCDIDLNEGKIDDLEKAKNCSYVPVNDQLDNAASIMYTASVPGVEHFCDDSGEHAHNYKAQNKQNLVCQGQSVWSVLRGHPDFKTRNAKRLMYLYSRTRRQTTTPTFRILRTPGVADGRLVMVLDVSGSMKGRPMDLLHAAASRAIQDQIPEGSRLGIVTFDTNARILTNLTLVDKNSRSRLIGKLPRKEDAAGYTAIGKGLLKGLDVLNTDGKSKGGRILLVSDGEENVCSCIKEVIPSLTASGVEVVAIAFGVKATDKLENLVTATGGKVFFFGDLKGTTPTSGLNSAFLEGTTIQTTEEFQPVRIVEEILNLGRDWIDRPLLVEDNLGKNLMISLTSPKISNLRLTLLDPNGVSLGPDNAHYDKDEVLQRIRVTVPNATNGTWRLSLQSTIGHVTGALTVLSFPQDSGSSPDPTTVRPLRIRAWVDNLEPKYPAAVRILSQVTHGGKPNDKLYKVIATVHRPGAGNKPIDIVLLDNGAEPDITGGDGIYSGFFTQFTGDGRYAVVVRLQARTKHANPNKGLARFRRGAAPEGFLERVADAGAFRLANWTTKDLIPPSRVTDLLARVELERRNLVWLTWTAPGGNMNHGRASKIELRMAHDPDHLRHNFTSCELINAWSENLTIEMGGAPQQAELTIPAVNDSTTGNITILYFALRAIDKAGNEADISNIASATLLPDQTSSLPLKEERNILIPLVASAGVLLVIVALVTLLVVINRRKEQMSRTHYFGLPADFKGNSSYSEEQIYKDKANC